MYSKVDIALYYKILLMFYQEQIYLCTQNYSSRNTEIRFDNSSGKWTLNRTNESTPLEPQEIMILNLLTQIGHLLYC